MIRIGINGFGRIGRTVAKVLVEQFAEQAEIVAINDLTDTKTLAHLFQYDTCYGIWPGKVHHDETHISIAGQRMPIYSKRDPSEIPWGKHDVDVVLECTGIFRTAEAMKAHLKAGAKKVVLSAPAKDEETCTYVMGVNHEQYKGEDMISNGSCTTNCIAPIIDVIHRVYGISSAMMTTVHSFTADQRLKDAPHKDLRRARNATQSIIPTTTGAALAVTKVIPSLAGKLEGMAFRVPTTNVSVADITCVVESMPEDIAELHDQFEDAMVKEYYGIMDISNEPLVSVDYKKNPYSCIVDALSTQMVGNQVKVIAWYDNEWGYSSRLAELALHIMNYSK